MGVSEPSDLGRRLALMAATGLLAAPAARADIVVKGDTVTNRVIEIRRHLAANRSLPFDSFANRFVAASLALKGTVVTDGTMTVSDEMAQRAFTVLQSYQPLADALAKTPLPDEYKALMEKEWGRRLLFAIRQGVPRMGYRMARDRLAGLPAESAMVTVEPGRTLADLVARAYPDFRSLSPLRQKLVYDGLARINPLVQPQGSFLAEAGKGEGAPGIRRVEMAPELEEPQMYQYLYALDPGTRLLAPDVVAAHAGQPLGEHLVLPVGGGAARVCRYRIPPGARLLMPPAAYLARLAHPERLDLKNEWLRDLSALAGLAPADLDLAGNDAADLAPLAAMKSLRRLRLDEMPIRDLSPLKGLALTSLDLAGTKVTDLAPLHGMKLTRLVLARTGVSDLAPLAGMPLEHLDLAQTPATNLTPLAGMPLMYLRLNREAAYASFTPLGGIASLQTIGDVPVDTWYVEYEKYRAERPAADQVPDIDCGDGPPRKTAPAADTKKPAASAAGPKLAPVPKPPPIPKTKTAPSVDDTISDLVDP